MNERNHENDRTARASIEVELEPAAAFDALIEELVTALGASGLVFEPGEEGRVEENGYEVGRVTSWLPGRSLALEWHPASWAPDERTEVVVALQAADGRTRVTVEQRGWGRMIDGAGEVAGWFATQIAAPLLRATAPRAFGDWLTDRGARRPSGAQARSIYRDPLYHYPNFRVILEELALTPEDTLIEVGCGGGALLHDALKSGCRAAAVDHSPEMVRLALDANRDAVEEGRLKVKEASADRLPFPDSTFSCAAMTGVLGFLPDPVAALREIRRVLARGGRFVGLGTDPELRGTPAAPEPMASRLRFYESDELEALAREAGFDEVRVVRRVLDAYAREVGVPEEHLALFGGPGARFLLARKS